MFCNHCGSPVQPDDHFCRGCGTNVAASGATSAAPAEGAAHLAPSAPAAAAPARRVARHLGALGVLWISISVFRGLGALAVLFVAHTILPNLRNYFPEARMEPPIPPFVFPLVSSIGVGLALFAVAGLAIGWGLLQKESWARTGAIILGILNLVEIPAGTALGIYTLWVLLPGDAENEYRALGRY